VVELLLGSGLPSGIVVKIIALMGVRSNLVKGQVIPKKSLLPFMCSEDFFILYGGGLLITDFGVELFVISAEIKNGRQIMQNLKLDWGEYAIAKNLNYFRSAKPDEPFWERWKSDKETLKAQGLSVFKGDDGEFRVFDWSRKDKASQEDYDKQQAERERLEKIEELRSKLRKEVELEVYKDVMVGFVDDLYNSRGAASLIREVKSCKSMDDLDYIVRREADNADNFWEQLDTDAHDVIETEVDKLLQDSEEYKQLKDGE
jgi:hypothetical protein